MSNFTIYQSIISRNIISKNYDINAIMERVDKRDIKINIFGNLVIASLTALKNNNN